MVGQLLVRDGDHVEAGRVVLRLDETIPRANYQIVTKQLDEFAVRSVRLEAERDGNDSPVLPEALAARRGEPAIAKLIAAETRLFEVRRTAREGQRQQLQKRISQLRDEIVGLKAQQAAKEKEAKIIATELVGVEELYRKNLVQLTRLSALQRDQVAIAGQRGQLVAAVAQSEGKIAEIELQIIQIDEELRAEVMKELREIQAREAELIERRTAADDQLRRVDLKAPTSGTVHQLAVHTVGGVVGPGEVVMLIVPADGSLELEAHVAPSEIDQVAVGQTARVRVQAGHQARNPELVGTVNRISADVTKDERQGFVFYTVRIAVPPEEFKRLDPIHIIAGMQAEAFIETIDRTPLDFILKPLRDQITRTFRER